MKKPHKPVLLQEVIDYLAPSTNKNFVDATLGYGGHSKEILKEISPEGILVGIDQDDEALNFSKNELEEFVDRVKFYKGNFEQIKEAVGDTKITGGVLADLGVSSLQLDKAERGFSFQENGPLDMRMDQTQEFTATTLVNTFDEKELSDLIYKYSDERFSRRIAANIVKAREVSKIADTKTLADIVSASIPRRFWPKGINPATRTFQAIRIAVNDEIGVLERFLPQAIEVLEPGARLGVISFHGTEDKIVKDFFAREANPCECPPIFPKCICGKTPKIRLVTRKAIKATAEEIRENPRSRSAKLRVVEKLSNN